MSSAVVIALDLSSRRRFRKEGRALGKRREGLTAWRCVTGNLRVTLTSDMVYQVCVSTVSDVQLEVKS